MDSVNNRNPETAQAAPDKAASLDAAQLAAIFDRCEKRIHGYILNNVRDAHTADDLTQDVFAKAWTSRETFNIGQDEAAWLIAIARNTIADHVKRLKAQKRDPGAGRKVSLGDGRFATGPTLDESARFAVDPAARIIDAERIAALNAAINGLDSSKRQAIELRRQGLSYKEIMVHMDLKNGTVGSLIKRAVDELKEMLGAHIE